MDRLDSMAVFVHAVERGSFAAVADAQHLSSQMVGRHIRGLEDRLGVKLLHRTTRRQSLTDVGRIYYERCKAVLAEVEAAEACAAEVLARPRGRLRIDAPTTFGANRLAPALPTFLAANPDVRVELTLNNRVLDLVDEGYDAVFRVGALADSGLMARSLAPYRLVACASPEYLSRRGTPISPVEMEAHACLGFRPNASREDWTFQTPDGPKAVRVSGPLASSSGQALRAAALAGVGIILQAEALVSDDLANGRLVPVLPDFAPHPLPLQLVFSPDRTMTPKLRAFIDFAVKQFGPDTDGSGGQ